jgi:hypothetical protein
MLGGDYTTGYVKQHKYADAVRTMLESYYFFWKYRPLYSPIINEEDKRLFENQEREFGYKKPDSVEKGDVDALAKYEKRLIVPEPDRFYSHGAGKPLLTAVVSIPQLALVKLVLPADKTLLYYQYNYNYHPIFILTRLAQLLAGLATILIIYRILLREYGIDRALLGASIMAFIPLSIKYFPNLHHDSFLAPFLILSAYYFTKERYIKAGILLGLALASKNTAVILGAAFLAYIISAAWYAHQSSGKDAALDLLSRGIKGYATVMVFGFILLLPFANPISYAQEILTPITHREYDPRGMNVDQFSVSQMLKLPGRDEVSSVIRPEVRLVQLLLHFQDYGFFFLVITVLLLLPRQKDSLTSLSFITLLFALPYGLVFGYTLNYRALLFVPFFVLLCVNIAEKKHLLGFVMLLLCMDVLYCIDPINTDMLHYPVNKESLWDSYGRSIAD